MAADWAQKHRTKMDAESNEEWEEEVFVLSYFHRYLFSELTVMVLMSFFLSFD